MRLELTIINIILIMLPVVLVFIESRSQKYTAKKSTLGSLVVLTLIAASLFVSYSIFATRMIALLFMSYGLSLIAIYKAPNFLEKKLSEVKS